MKNVAYLTAPGVDDRMSCSGDPPVGQKVRNDKGNLWEESADIRQTVAPELPDQET